MWLAKALLEVLEDEALQFDIINGLVLQVLHHHKDKFAQRILNYERLEAEDFDCLHFILRLHAEYTKVLWRIAFPILWEQLQLPYRINHEGVGGVSASSSVPCVMKMSGYVASASENTMQAVREAVAKIFLPSKVLDLQLAPLARLLDTLVAHMSVANVSADGLQSAHICSLPWPANDWSAFHRLRRQLPSVAIYRYTLYRYSAFHSRRYNPVQHANVHRVSRHHAASPEIAKYTRGGKTISLDPLLLLTAAMALAQEFVNNDTHDTHDDN
ncbi:hypothetical protein HDU87_004672 [Geranomyces variabilis]|uniref:Uncharacterized protein n=1 Tax=Geranomyces variabilis TaxID=109894 RepID=A0AAD5TKH2_9FUNG|nr:hypothetical protein HDU87_004672 [Geranomyces variabilis]